MNTLPRLPVVLVVDDNETVRMALERCLKGLCHVISAASAQEGFELLRSQKVSVVISDYKMPNMDGVEFLRRVKILNPDQVVIMITGYADLEVVTKVVNSVGIEKFIVKPWNTRELKLMVAKTLALVERREALRSAQKAGKDVTKGEVDVSSEALAELEKEYPGISTVEKDKDGNILSGFE
ncbi:MAG: response regulator [Desulfobacterales bacterium]|nr:response regulator [Desulfobacterales bacterium]